MGADDYKLGLEEVLTSTRMKLEGGDFRGAEKLLVTVLRGEVSSQPALELEGWTMLLEISVALRGPAAGVEVVKRAPTGLIKRPLCLRAARLLLTEGGESARPSARELLEESARAEGEMWGVAAIAKLDLGRLDLEDGDPGAALERALDVFKGAKEGGHPDLGAASCLLGGVSAMRLGQEGEASGIFEAGLSAFSSWSEAPKSYRESSPVVYDQVGGGLYGQMAMLLSKRGESSRARVILEERRSHLGEDDAMSALARGVIKSREGSAEAGDALREAQRLAEASGDVMLQVQALLMLSQNGETLKERGAYIEAAESCIVSGASMPVELVFARAELALALGELEDCEVATAELNQGQLTVGERRRLAILRGQIDAQRGMLSAALSAYRSVLEYEQVLGRADLQAASHLRIARLLRRAKEFAGCRQQLERARELDAEATALLIEEALIELAASTSDESLGGTLGELRAVDFETIGNDLRHPLALATAALERHEGAIISAPELLRGAICQSEADGHKLQSLSLLMALSHLGYGVSLSPEESKRLEELLEELGAEDVDILAFPESF